MASNFCLLAINAIATPKSNIFSGFPRSWKILESRGKVMENSQKVESYRKNFAKGLFKCNFFILKTFLQVIVLVRFFALANRPCQHWTKVIFSCLSLLLFGLDQELAGGVGRQAIAGGIAGDRHMEEAVTAVTLTFCCENMVSDILQLEKRRSM